MINYATLKSNLRTWAVAQTIAGVDVIHANQNAPAPQVTYVSMRISATARIGNGHTEAIDDETGTAIVRGMRELTVEFQAFGSGATEQLELIVSSLERPTVIETLQAMGIAYVRQLTSVMDLTGIAGPGREERAGVDLRFRIGTPYGYTEDGDAVGAIERVEITDERRGVSFVVNPPLAEE